MATQMQYAREGKITDAMRQVAEAEQLTAENIRERVAKGTVAICANVNHVGLKPAGVGAGLRTKVNANIGTSSTFPDIGPELEKLDAASMAGSPLIHEGDEALHLGGRHLRIAQHHQQEDRVPNAPASLARHLPLLPLTTLTQ